MFCVTCMKFTRFLYAKTKRVRRYSLCTYPAALIGHFLGMSNTKYAFPRKCMYGIRCKITTKNWYEQIFFRKNSIFCYFFAQKQSIWHKKSDRSRSFCYLLSYWLVLFDEFAIGGIDLAGTEDIKDVILEYLNRLLLGFDILDAL